MTGAALDELAGTPECDHTVDIADDLSEMFCTMSREFPTMFVKKRS
jgi:hypothetical protein